MRRTILVLAGLLVTSSLSGCFALAGAAVDAGFRDLTDHGRHPLYQSKSYGEHFADALLEDHRPHEVEVTVYTRRHHR